MRQEQRSITAAPTAVGFTFRFQMTNAGARHACCVTIRAASQDSAAAIFRANWPTIEELARLRLVANERTEIRLETD
jgi:hypothetical protein